MLQNSIRKMDDADDFIAPNQLCNDKHQHHPRHSEVFVADDVLTYKYQSHVIRRISNQHQTDIIQKLNKHRYIY